MWHVHSCSRFVLTSSKFIGFLYLHVRTVTSVCFDIGILYLAHWSITMRGCVKYFNDPDTTLTFDLKVKFIEFMTWPCVQASSFFSFEIVILCLARECITMVRCVAYIYELWINLTLTSIYKFSPWIWVWQDIIGVTNFGMTLGWPWPLTYMLLARGILTEFHSLFYLFIYSMMGQLISRYDPFRQEVIVESRGHCILHLPWRTRHKRRSLITLRITSFYLPMQVRDADYVKRS